MSLEFKDLDKTDFECWQMDDGSVYYGQIAYVDQDNKIVEDVEEAKRQLEEQQQENEDPDQEQPEPKFKKVRHGLGVNCYGRSEGEDILCKYEGNWDRDRKTGEGFLVFPDGSTYKGSFKNDIIDGFGIFEWRHYGHRYEGNWKDGLMEGGGEFYHTTGRKIKGSFINNYHNFGGMFINPFMSEEQAQAYLMKCEAYKIKMDKPNQEPFA